MVVELLTFLGLALLLEGVIMALFPMGMRRMLDQFAALAPGQLRIIGLRRRGQGHQQRQH